MYEEFSRQFVVWYSFLSIDLPPYLKFRQLQKNDKRFDVKLRK